MANIDGTIVYVFTEQFDQMRGYYQRSLGVEPQDGGPDWCWFDLGGGKQLALHNQTKPPSDTKPFHLTLTVSDIDASVAQFQRAGAKLTAPVRDEPFGKLAILRDPEGREFSLVQEK